MTEYARICQQLQQELPLPLSISPDGRFVALATPTNTVVVLSAKKAICTYFGHREGIYHLSGRVTDLSWQEDGKRSWIITSRSTTGATHRWNLQGVHLQTVKPANMLLPKE